MKLRGGVMCKFVVIVPTLVLTGCADLVVPSVNHVVITVPGGEILKATVRNEGQRGAPESKTRLEVQMPPAATFAQVANRSTPALGSGQQIELDLWGFNLYSIPAGQCMQARVCADSEDTVWEGWFGGENNNCRTSSVCRN